MHPCKRRRSSVAAPEPALPPDVLLEIVARSDAATLVRCAASSKSLRREILRPAFIRRVCDEPGGVVPPRLLGFLRLGNANDHGGKVPGRRPPVGFSLAHPATPAAESFSEKHLAPLLSRNAAAANLFDGGGEGDRPLASRNGLVLLYGGFKKRPPSRRRRPSFPHMCVYDPMAGDLATFRSAPGIYPDCTPCTFVLLTAADGIGCSFLVVVVDFTGLMDGSGSINIQTMSADGGGGGAWGPPTSVQYPRAAQGSSPTLHRRSSQAAVVGGFIHWLMYELKWESRPPYAMHILTYHVGTATAGTIDLPTVTDGIPMSELKSRDLDLASSPDGRLSLLVIDRQPLTVSIWLLSAGDGWARHAVIDAEAKLRSLQLDQPLSRRGLHNNTDNKRILYIASRSWAKSGAVVLMRFPVCPDGDEGRLIVLDVGTEEMWTATTKTDAFLYEVDLQSRLSAMKTF